MVFDAAGNRLQPTHSNKNGRKYRYYVSAPAIRDAKTNPDGLRIPAPDLEKIVIQSIAARLRDQQWLSSTFELQSNLSGFGRLIDAAVALAKEVEQQPAANTGILNLIIKRIDVDRKLIKVSINVNQSQRLLVGSKVDLSNRLLTSLSRASFCAVARR